MNCRASANQRGSTDECCHSIWTWHCKTFPKLFMFLSAPYNASLLLLGIHIRSPGYFTLRFNLFLFFRQAFFLNKTRLIHKRMMQRNGSILAFHYATSAIPAFICICGKRHASRLLYQNIDRAGFHALSAMQALYFIYTNWLGSFHRTNLKRAHCRFLPSDYAGHNWFLSLLQNPAVPAGL